jgi:hypothetical protein
MRVQAFTDEELALLTQKFEAWTDADCETATIKGAGAWSTAGSSTRRRLRKSKA